MSWILKLHAQLSWVEGGLMSDKREGAIFLLGKAMAFTLYTLWLKKKNANNWNGVS